MTTRSAWGSIVANATGMNGRTRTCDRGPVAKGWRKVVRTGSQSGKAGSQRIDVYTGALGQIRRRAATTFSEPATFVSHSWTRAVSKSEYYRSVAGVRRRGS